MAFEVKMQMTNLNGPLLTLEPGEMNTSGVEPTVLPRPIDWQKLGNPAIRVEPGNLPPVSGTNLGVQQVQINTSGVEPVGWSVLVQTYEPKKLSSTIVIPTTATERLNMVEQRAVVIEVGPAAWKDEPYARAQPGDHVLLSRYAGTMIAAEVAADGKDNYRLVKDIEIMCRIKNKEA